jgi:hypothetical protein
MPIPKGKGYIPFGLNKLKKIRWMTEKEVKEYDWLGSAPVIEFTDGTIIIASMDDEGNDAGALFTNDSECSVLPRI